MIASQSKVDHPRAGYTNTHFCSCDLDLDLMTLIHKPDIEILKMYLYIKNELSV